MVSVYSDADLLAAYKQKKKLWNVFLAITAAYLAFCGGWLAYYISLPYKDPMQALPQACVYIASGVYAIIIFPFMAIKYSRVRRYFKMISYVGSGMKNEEKNHFYCFEEKSLQKDNIDVMGCVFETWNKKKCEWMEREVYFDKEKPLPEFDAGDYVQYVVQSNFIVQYNILQKKALEFEEVDEDDDYLLAENGMVVEEPENAKDTETTEVED